MKTECPICLRHTRAYYEDAPTVAGVEHLFIKPDDPEATQEWAKGFDASQNPVIYQDPDAQLAEAFNVPDGYQFHGEEVHYPALILLDPEGKEVFRYIGEDNSDRYSFEQFQKKMAELRADSRTWHLHDDVAFQAFDPVAYRTQEQPVQGEMELFSWYGGAIFHFASEENRQKFNASPESYLPEFGGWCAMGMARGQKYHPQPDNFILEGDKLYFFWAAERGNAKDLWLQDPEENLEKAEANWESLAGE